MEILPTHDDYDDDDEDEEEKDTSLHRKLPIRKTSELFGFCRKTPTKSKFVF